MSSEDKSKDVPYYNKDPPTIDPSTLEVLEIYSKIPSADIESHIFDIRDRGWEVFNYPCIGQFRFLDLSLGKAPQYPEVLERVKQGQRLVDLGCCFGQDLRRLVVDGAPDAGANLHGTDLKSEFFDLGYDLFRDKETLRSKFMVADIFDSASPLSQLQGTVDIIHASSFIHLFGWDGQVEVLRSVVKLLKPEKGSLILGRHVGSTEAGEKPGRTPDARMYRHNEESWRKLWDLISEETGTKWNVTFIWDDSASWARSMHNQAQDPTVRPMRYAVWRL